MLTQGEDVEVHALKERGWTITAIAHHLGHDRKTVRVYLNGERVPGVRARVAPDPLEPFVPYLTQRLLDDPHVWASALFDEVMTLGYALSYPSFARQVRLASLRPHCEACAGVKGVNASWTLRAMYVNQVTTSWGVNAKGETYGVMNQQGTPDLLHFYDIEILSPRRPLF